MNRKKVRILVPDDANNTPPSRRSGTDDFQHIELFCEQMRAETVDRDSVLRELQHGRCVRAFEERVQEITFSAVLLVPKRDNGFVNMW